MDGYKTVSDLTTFNNWTQSFRYRVLKLEKDGRFFLFKQANDDFTKQLLKNEVRFRQFFDALNIASVSTTEIVNQGDDYILFKWLDAKLLAERNHDDLGDFKKNLDRYVDLMVQINLAGVDYAPTGDEAAAIKPESRFDSPFINKYQKILENVQKAGWITQDEIDQIRILHEKYLPYSKGGYQHGDFTPWHIFSKGNEWFIYDAEHASSLRSRYTDLAHSYARIACQCESPELAGKMLKKFIEKSGASEQDFKNVAMSEFVRKAAGSVVDSYNDREQADYRKAAMNFLDSVLKDDLETLIA